MSLSYYLDTIDQRIPTGLKPALRPLHPIYKSGLDFWFRLAPERTTETPWGPKIRVNPANFVERRLAYGEFEKSVIEYFRDELIPSTTQFADIGANIGFYSIFFAMYSKNSEVHAFEPLPNNIKRFRTNLDINDVTSVKIHEFALSNATDSADLLVSNKHPGESSIASNPDSSKKSRTVTVDLRTIDDLADEGITPDLLKIDVEGAEYRVLEGGREYLSETLPNVLVEVHPNRLGDFGNSVEELKELLGSLGYEHAVQINTGDRFTISSMRDIDFDKGSHIHLE